MPKNPCASQIHHSYFQILFAQDKYNNYKCRKYPDALYQRFTEHDRPTTAMPESLLAYYYFPSH